MRLFYTYRKSDMRDWRAYQLSLVRQRQRRIWLRRGVWLVALSVLAVALTWGALNLRTEEAPQTAAVRSESTATTASSPTLSLIHI